MGIAALTSTLLLGALLSVPSRAYAVAPTPVALGTAATYSALGRTNVVNSLGPTILSGDLGVTPDTIPGTITGFGADLATVHGTTHINDAAAVQAQADMLIAYNDAQGRTAAGQFGGERRIEVSNTTSGAVEVALYPAAATVANGSFLGSVGRTPNDLSTWTSVSPSAPDVPPAAR